MFEQIVEKIKKYDSIVIFGHLNPDGDCYGAQVGLREVILSLYPNKKVYITGTGCPRYFALLPKMDEVSDEIIKESLAILVDANDLSRMEDQRIYNAIDFCKIDHHIDTGSFKEGPQVVDTSANSACDLITRMVIEINAPISELGATALYLGILTDSARFQFVENYPETFERAKFLCEKGAQVHKLNALMAITDENTQKAKGYILSHYKKTEGGVIYIVYSKHLLKRLKLSANKASSMINLLGNIEGYPIWASFAEYEDGKVRVEFRSNGPAIQPCAVRIGGGGHAQASGAQLPELDKQVIDKILEDLDNTLAEWRKEQ